MQMPKTSSLGDTSPTHGVRIANLKRLLLVVSVLLLGWIVRMVAQDAVKQRMGFDDAYYALDAVSLIDQPRLTPFFPDNLGRESGWMYFLVPFLAAIGKTPFAVHYASAWIGILTVAAVYRLASVLLRGRGGLWAAAIYAVLFGPVVFNYIGFRALTYPLVGALSLSLLLEAVCERNWKKWLLGGVLVGILAYTYFSARVVIGLCGLIMLIGLYRRQTRLVAGAALALALILSLPLVIYTLEHPDETTGRIVGSATLNATALSQNLVLWLRAPFLSGDTHLEYSIPGRPLFDIANGILWCIGIVVSLLRPGSEFRRKWFAPFTFLLAGLTVLPSLISYGAPNTLRAVGLFIASAIWCGAGASWIETSLHLRGNLLAHRMSQIGLLGAIALSTVITVVDLARWLTLPGQYYSRHQYTHEAVDFIKANLPATMPVYFNPEELKFDNAVDAVIRFRSADLSPRHVGAVDTRTCYAIPDVPSVYTAFEAPQIHSHFDEAMQPWARTQQVYQTIHVADIYTTYTQTLYIVEPQQEQLRPENEPVYRLGNDQGALFELRMSAAPESIRAGEIISVALRFRALVPTRYDYRVTLSLVNDPDGYLGRNRWVERDDFICPMYGSTQWLSSETVIRQLELQAPADAPSDRYALILRVYGGEPNRSVEELRLIGSIPNDKYAGKVHQTLRIVGSRESLNDPADVKALTQVDGYIREWNLIGGFPDATLDDDVLPGGEANFHPPDVGAELLRSQSAKIDLRRFVRPAEHNVAYMYVWLKSPDDRKGLLGMNSDDGVAVWLNGNEVWRNKVSRYMPEDLRDIDLPPIDLKRGWNLLLVKVDQSDGEWAYKVRVLQSDGSVMHDIEVSTVGQ